MSMELKKCKSCQLDKDEDDYYMSEGRYLKKCKACVINKTKERYHAKKVPKKTINQLRFEKLQPEDITNIQNDLNTQSIRKVAEKHNIGYQTLMRWIQSPKYPLKKSIMTVD